MANPRRRLAYFCIYALVLIAQCRASADLRRLWRGRCTCRPIDLVPISRVFHRHHSKHPLLWNWYEATRKRPYRHRYPTTIESRFSHDSQEFGPVVFLQEKQLPDDEIDAEDDVAQSHEAQSHEACPCAEELYWAINTQKTVLSIIGSLEEEKQDLEQTEKALATKGVAELHLQASHKQLGITQEREDKAEDDIALEAADLEQAQEATLATQDSSSGGSIDNLQQDTAVVEQTDQLADIQSQQLDSDVLEKKVALEKIHHIAHQANVHVADMEVKSKIQSADIHEDRVPTELEINQAIRMLEQARPRVQTEEAQLVVERCLHELQQALGLSAQVQELEQRIELQVSKNSELQSDEEEAFDQSPAGAGASPDAAVAQPASYWAADAPVAQMRRTRTVATRKEQEEQLRRRIRGSAKKLLKLEARFEDLER